MSSDAAAERGILFVVSAPSGTGKTTVVEQLVQKNPHIWRSRSYTSRAARPGEVDGVDYNFVSRQAFEELIRADELLEWADIFGNLYGTRRRDTEATLASGIDLVLVIDVQGARLVRERVLDAVAIFLLPPSFEALVERLRGRNQDPEAAIQERLATARREVTVADQYDYVVVNEGIDRCVAELDAIVKAERARLTRRQAAIRPIISTFEQM
ncbi:MAG: guanylate kinase [Acidobacteriota bacterium]